MDSNFEILSPKPISEHFRSLNLTTFSEAANYIQTLPYKRNPDKTDKLSVLKDQGGTCSTKHAVLKRLADENKHPEIKLMLGIFGMKASYSEKLIAVFEKYRIDEMPEAHNYLRFNGKVEDFTARNCKEFENELIVEVEIQPEQITDFKVSYHKEFLRKYLEENSHIPYSLDEFWIIREACIEALQN